MAIDTATTAQAARAGRASQPGNGAAAPLTSPRRGSRRDPLDGLSVVDLPTALKIKWDVDLYDSEDEPHDPRILEANDPFQVKFRMRLDGALWQCMNVDFFFDLGFDPIGGGDGFYLSDKIGPNPLWYRGWTGCGGSTPDPIELAVQVPPGTIPVRADGGGKVYELAGSFQMYCCGKRVAAVTGFEALEEYEFYDPTIDD
jgi:hypothetical protein